METETKIKKKKTTTRDIARECFVSQSAVSMILSGRTDIHFSRETIRLVKEKAEEMGYEYKPRTRKPKTTTAATILIMCPSLATQYYTSLVQAINLTAVKEGLTTLTAYTDRKTQTEEYYLHMAEDCGFYGVIYTYAPHAIRLVNHIYKKIPVVLINDYNPELKVELLELDSKKSGRIIAAHLYELGHRHIAYVTTPLLKEEIPRLRRLQGMKEFLAEQEEDPEQIEILCKSETQEASIETNTYYDTGYQLTLDYFNPEKIQKATAFVGTNDLVSVGIIDALHLLKYRIPKDYSVCGFDNTLTARLSNISLTSVEHCIAEKGSAAVNMLMNQQTQLKKGRHSAAPRMRLEYEPQLIIRKSTGKSPISP